MGEQSIVINGHQHMAKFVKIAVNVVRRIPGGPNVLGDVLHGWFGSDAGASGMIHRVYLRRTETGWILGPKDGSEDGNLLELHHEYMVKEIKEFFVRGKRLGNWMTGYVRLDTASVLLVTLEKKNVEERYRYRDRFASPEIFEWDSPAGTTREGDEGQEIIHHVADGRTMHLFVREQKKRGSKTVPYTYCGTINLEDCQSEKPMQCRFRLDTPLPEDLSRRFGKSSGPA